MLLVPDTAQPKVYKEEIAPRLAPGKTLMFAHGFNIRYETISPRPDVDVSMIAPKGPGHRVRETFQAGQGVPALIAVHRDASRQGSRDRRCRMPRVSAPRARGCSRRRSRRRLRRTSSASRPSSAAATSALVKAAFDTLVQAGYQPEVAYFECLHELKLIVDLMYRGGLRYMRYSISDTAEYGDYVSGPRVVDAHTRETMTKLLEEIRSGTFARKWIDENETGRRRFEAQRTKERDLPIEKVGEKLRAMMPFLDPVKAESSE